MIRKTLVVTLASFTALATAGPQETGTPEEPLVAFPAEIEQVTVDVVVVDKKGQPITDLAEGEIEVYEDGVRQTIASFDTFEVERRETEVPAVEAPAPETQAPPRTSLVRSRVSSNTDLEERQARTFVIVFDDVHLTVFTVQQAKAAVAEFLKTETSDGDRVTLVAPGSGDWWTTRLPEGRDELLEVLQRQEALLFPDTQKDRMSDYEAMRIHLFRDNMILNRIHRRYATFGVQNVRMRDFSKNSVEFFVDADPHVLGKAAEVYYQATARNHVTLGAMERALQSLVRIQGRKSMILVSDGFVYDTHLTEFKRILTASRRANTAIYFLNSRGLQGLPSMMDAEFSQMRPQMDMGFAFSQEYETSEGSASLALDTGGFTVRNSNDLAGGLKRIADETRAYYLIGYNPSNTNRDGKFRKIEVKIPDRDGITIRARRGYYAPSDAEVADSTPPGTDPVFQSALDSPYAIDDIGLRMTHVVREETFLGKARVFVAAEVNIDDLQFESRDGLDLAALNFLMVTVHRESGEYFRYDQKMDLRLPPETHAQLSRTWLPIVRDFELEPGHYRAKIVLRDKATERLGTVIHNFEVPDVTRFRVSTPVLSDMRETTSEGRPGERLAIMARREFAPESTLFCQLDVYGATRLASSGMPRVTMGYEVRRSDGTVFTNEAPSLVLPTEVGGVSRMIGFPLEWATPGDYELVMNVKDELSGKRVELREPFRVAPAPAASPPAQAEPPPSPSLPAPTTPTGR